jgi:hypothetical protein
MILKADEGDRPGEGEAPGIEEDPVAAAALGEAFLAVLKAGSGEPTAIRQEEIGPVDFPRPVAVAGRLPGGGAKPFQEAALSVAYPPGSLAAIMERHRLVGVWVVSGIVTEATAQGRGLLLRAALVDRNGTVRFSDLVAESAPADLRDPGGAQRVARALLAEYPTIAENRRAGQDVGHAMEAPHAMEARADTPRFLHPADFRLGLGVFFVAGTDLWAGFLPRNSRWQFGYRYVLWNDTFEDPYTGRELTETTESLQGPQVNFLFRPEKRGTWYLGTSALQWSKSETAKANGVTDSASVTSLFLGGGYTHRLGKHVYWSGAMFLAPWADLSTDTGASSDESSGGFDVQIQIGGAF